MELLWNHQWPMNALKMELYLLDVSASQSKILFKYQSQVCFSWVMFVSLLTWQSEFLWRSLECQGQGLHSLIYLCLNRGIPSATVYTLSISSYVARGLTYLIPAYVLFTSRQVSPSSLIHKNNIRSFNNLVRSSLLCFHFSWNNQSVVYTTFLYC